MSDLDKEILGFAKLNDEQQVLWIRILKEFYFNHFQFLSQEYPDKTEQEITSLQESEILTSILRGSLVWLMRDTRIRSSDMILNWCLFESNLPLLELIHG